MSRLDWRFVAAAVLVGGLVAIDAYFAAWTPRTFAPDRSRIPETVGKWRGTEIRLSEEELKRVLGDGRLTYDERHYRADDAPMIEALTVYLERPEAIRHTPDRCLTVSGWAVDRVSTVDVALPEEDGFTVANLLTGVRGDRKIVEVYVFVTAKAYRRTPLQTLVEYSSNRLSSKDQAMAMVILVSRVPFEEDEQETIDTVVAFAGRYLPHVRATLTQ